MSAMAIAQNGSTKVWRSAMFNAMLPTPRRCVVIDQTIAAAATYPTGGIPFNVSQWPTGIGSSVDFVQCALFGTTSNAASNLAAAKYQPVWDQVGQVIRLYKMNDVITAESVTATLGAMTALTYIPIQQVLSVVGTVNVAQKVYYEVPAAATLADNQFKVNYTTGVITCYYDGSHTPTSVTVDYIATREMVTTEVIAAAPGVATSGGTAVTLRMMVWGY